MLGGRSMGELFHLEQHSQQRPGTDVMFVELPTIV